MVTRMLTTRERGRSRCYPSSREYSPYWGRGSLVNQEEKLYKAEDIDFLFFKTSASGLKGVQWGSRDPTLATSQWQQDDS